MWPRASTTWRHSIEPKATTRNLNLPGGVLIFGAMREVDRALRFGLYEKICAWLTHQGAKARTAALADA